MNTVLESKKRNQNTAKGKYTVGAVHPILLRLNHSGLYGKYVSTHKIY
jgi:hypothetical protein